MTKAIIMNSQAFSRADLPAPGVANIAAGAAVQKKVSSRDPHPRRKSWPSPNGLLLMKLFAQMNRWLARSRKK